MTMTDPTSTDARLRAQAIARLRARQEFRMHLSAYVVVNVMLVGIWAGTGGPFWPIFPMFGWGLGVLGHALIVFRPPLIAEERVQREIKRLEDERTR